MLVFPLPCLQRQRQGGEGSVVETPRKVGNQAEPGMLLSEVTVKGETAVYERFMCM